LGVPTLSAYNLSSLISLPEQDMELIRRLSLRWMRAAGPHNVWAKKAKQCTEFLEGEQYTKEDAALMKEVGRTALTINKINPLWRLVMGYQTNNRMDVSFSPTSDAQSTEDTAQVITNIHKSECERVDARYIDTEVFADGLTGGRGYWDSRLCFDENDLGEWALECDDPYSIYIDPDNHYYDLDKGASYIQQSKWVSIDCINALYGSAAAMAVKDLTNPSYTSSMMMYMGEQDISPERFFGQYADDKGLTNFADVYHTDFVDHQAKRIRLLESQYKITRIRPCFIDVKSGVKEPIPDDWLKPENHHKIIASLEHAQAKGDEIMIAKRPVKSVRWTVTCADVLLHDDWSIYESYTKIGFFPYFRRGKVRGMIDDLIDPQREVNKKRSVMNDILIRNSNSGWMYEKGSLDPEMKQNIIKFGASPGINIEYSRVNGGEMPKRIEPGGFPQGLDRLEMKAQDDLMAISGINESALGQLDRVQSGRAIEARQRQAVLAIQLYQDNFGRSKKLLGRNFLEIVQNHYTEERIFRLLGEDSRIVTYEINKKIMTGVNSFDRLNDITVGKYGVGVDEVPISATFKQAQFEETMVLIEKLGPVGAMLVQTAPDLLIDMTSLPRKDDWKRALMMSSAMTPPDVAMGASGPTGGGIPMQQRGTPEGMPS